MGNCLYGILGVSYVFSMQIFHADVSSFQFVSDSILATRILIYSRTMVYRISVVIPCCAFKDSVNRLASWARI